MSAAQLKAVFLRQSEPPDGRGENGIIAQCVLYPARENHPRDDEMRNAAQMAIDVAQAQLKKAYETSRTGRIYDLYVRLQYSDCHGSAELSVTCADSVDKIVRQIKSEIFAQTSSVIQNAFDAE
ncbi:MAG: hypothetical protein ACK4VI_08810 [Alphaproteobacteria bacterium]